MIETLTLVQDRNRILIQDARPRRLGSLFIPLRRSYMVGMPALLFGTAILCWATGTDASMLVGALVLTGVAAYLLFDLLGRRAPLRVTTILVATLALAYGLGTANTWFTLPRAGESLGEFLHIDTVDLAHAMGSVLASCALTLSIGELLEKPIFGEDFVLQFNNRAVVFITLGTLALASSYLLGSTSFMGAVVSGGAGEEYGHVSILASLTEWLSGSLLALFICVSLNIPSRFSRLYTRYLSVLLFLMIFPLGRRVMIYAIVLTLIGLRLGRYKVPFSPLKKVILLGLVSGFLYAASIGFFYLRIAGYTLVHPTLIQRISAAIRVAETRSYSEIKDSFAANVETRTFILGFLGKLEGYTDTLPGAHGTDLLHNAELALPSLLYQSKDLTFSEEKLADDIFGASFLDEANSVLTTGAVDFGVWGILLYPLLMTLMIRSFLEVVAESLPVFASCFIILSSLSALLEPEIALTSYFLILRNGLFFGSGVWLIMSLPEFRIKNVSL